MADWRDRRVPEFQAYLRNVLGREPAERDYAAAIMQLEARGPGSVAVGHAFRNRVAADGGDPASHLRHYDPVALGHRWREVTPAAIDKWGAEYDKIASGEGPLRPGQTHFFSPAGMQAYYAKDPSLVRSAVRMDVPGHGSVLVPSWATKAVSAGDFVNVNGQWHLTPNERYGQDGAPPAPPRDTQIAAAPPSERQDTPDVSPPVARVASEPDPQIPSASASSSPSSGQMVDTAMRVARAFSGSQQKPEHETDSIIETTSGASMPRPRVQMAEAPIPYLDKVKRPMILTRADGGSVDAGPNDFKPLTADQKAMIERDKINESLGPFDFMPGPMTALGGVVGGLGTGFLFRDMLRHGGIRHAVKDLPISSLPTLGGAGIGYAMDKKDDVLDRMRREEMMMNGNQMDAEGQAEGFYGEYKKRADGGPVEPPAGGAGRFASPVPLIQTDDDTFMRRVMDRLSGVDRSPYADGGAIDDTGANIPETRDALMAQQRQLIEGRRVAQMFPVGTEELPLPPGMDRIETSRGVFHFDPLRISPRDIERASFDGRENDILGLGPLSKDDVSRVAMETGETPVAITERDRMGNELRASLATPSTVPMQSDEMLRSAAPDNTIDIEPVADVVGRRGAADKALALSRADGGQVEELRDRRRRQTNALMAMQFDRATPQDSAVVEDERGGIAPVATYANGLTGLAFPRMVTDPIQSFNRLLQHGYQPGDTKGVEDAFNVAGAAMVGGLAAPRPNVGRAARAAPERSAPTPASAPPVHTVGGPYTKLTGDPDYDGWMMRLDEQLNDLSRSSSGTSIQERGFHGSADPALLDPRARQIRASMINTGPWGSSSSQIANSYTEGRKVGSARGPQDGSMVMPVEFRFNNPMVYDARGGMWDDLPLVKRDPYEGAYLDTDRLSIAAESRGHDGLVVRNVKDDMESARGVPATTYHAIKPGTVYSATTGDLLYANGGKGGAAAGASVNALRDPADDQIEGRASGGGISDVIKGIAGSGLLGIAPMAFADGVDEEDLISPMAGLMRQKARGGGIAGGPVVGALVGSTGGRADKVPASARSGSHVVPSDIVSHMGQGNTNAGLKALERMFKTGPYGTKLPTRRRAEGGGVGDIPVMLSDGEFVIPPEIVAEIGGGDIQTGHDVIDGWIMDERQRHIQTLQDLPPPATD